MNKKFLLLYSTVDGQTLRICERLKEGIERHGHSTALVRLDRDTRIDLAHFDTIVIGASIRYGKHRPEVIRFINTNARELQGKGGALFSVNVVARKEAKNSPQTNPYMRKLLRQIAWRPGGLAVFAGKIDYPRYGPLDRAVIRFIMWMTRGPTDVRAVVEFTDWQKVDAFAQVITNL